MLTTNQVHEKVEITVYEERKASRDKMFSENLVEIFQKNQDNMEIIYSLTIPKYPCCPEDPEVQVRQFSRNDWRQLLGIDLTINI